jgi:hypothetical protein
MQQFNPEKTKHEKHNQKENENKRPAKKNPYAVKKAHRSCLSRIKSGQTEKDKAQSTK